MRYVFSRSLAVLLAAFMSVGCSNGEQGAEKRAAAETGQVDVTALTRHCYRNEYPFDGEPEQKDVQTLTLEIDGKRVVGEYNWLPAFKDKRVGRFEGSIDGQSATVTYEYTQEGQSAVATISIRLEPEQVVVEGGEPELGLNATIAKEGC